MEPARVATAVDQLVHRPWVAVEREDHRPVGGEEVVEHRVGVAVRVLLLGQQRHEVHDVDEPDLQLRSPLAQQLGRRQRLLGGHVSGSGDDDVRLLPRADVRGPVPDTGALRTERVGLLHARGTAGAAACRGR